MNIAVGRQEQYGKRALTDTLYITSDKVNKA